MPSDEHESAALRGLRILIVDADAPSAKLLQAVLENEGCQFRVAGTGKEALTVLPEFKPDLILLELVLADVVGLDFVRLLKASPAVTARLVAVTASNGPETRRLALEAGCIDYVRKPIDALGFAARLRSLLGKPLDVTSTASKRGVDS